MEKTINILVVDDSPSWGSIYAEVLSENGYSVRVASDLAGALDCLNQQFFHAAVVDIRLDANDLDNVDGLKVLQRIWELNEGTVAVVSSAHATADMLPAFRTYNVFDFVTKNVAGPADLARQYQSAAFIKNTIDKAGSLEDGLNRIELAIPEARRTFTNRQWLQSPFGMFNGVSARTMQSRLKSGGMVELRPFLGRLCRPLYPWLLPGPESGLSVLCIRDEQAEDLAYESYAWSRRLGKPVAVRVGRRNRFADSLRLAPLGSGWDGAEPGSEIVHLSSDHFEGFACALTNKRFEDDFRAPPPRRTRNHA